MTSFHEANRIVEQEARSERRAAIDLGGTSFTDILRANSLPIDAVSTEKVKGQSKEVRVRGQDISDSGLWRKFLKHLGKSDGDLISLVSDVEPLTESLDQFLETSYTERYSNLSAEGKIWRRQVVRLAVTYHVMENKLDGYRMGLDTFADERVAYFWTLVRTIRDAMAGAARVIHHIIEDEEKAKHYLNEFFTAHYEQFRSIPFPQRDDILRLVKPDTGDGAGMAVSV